MDILIACEESGTVTKAFRDKGHNAWSCDLLPTSGPLPEYHIHGDAIAALYSRHWDLVIAHPPCTRLANSGVMWLEKRNLWNELKEACNFFNEFVKYGEAGNRICIENPIPHKYATIPKYTQVIQPYMFGHTERKATCLWLYNLPKLQPTNNVYEQMKNLPKNEQQRIHYLPPSPDRAKLRSKTFPGIAAAIAAQYG